MVQQMMKSMTKGGKGKRGRLAMPDISSLGARDRVAGGRVS